MSCDCINRLEALLTEDMKKKFPGFDVEEKVEFQNKTLVQEHPRHPPTSAYGDGT